MDLENILYIKRLAKKLKKEKKIKHSEALDIISKEKGYMGWKDLLNKNKGEGDLTLDINLKKFKPRKPFSKHAS